ncbi:MAG: dTMP kinase [Bacillales bacterium]
MFITFEGVEGCGKSSIINYVYQELIKENKKIILTREPGGVKISEDIRNIILDKSNTNLDKRTETLLFAASRRQHLVEKVWPALANNTIVLCDRYIDSSLAYQGIANEVGMDEVLNVNMFATENTLPDYTILLDLDPIIGLERINKNSNREVNRIDLKQISFHEKVRNGYLLLAEKYPERIIVINANNSFDIVKNEVLQVIREKINEPK